MEEKHKMHQSVIMAQGEGEERENILLGSRRRVCHARANNTWVVSAWLDDSIEFANGLKH